MMTKRKKMIAHNSNEGSRHIGVVWFIWYAADCARTLGQLVAIDYSDATPDVAFTYDRQGRPLTVTDILGTRTNVYSPTNLLEERHPDGSALVRSYDAYGRASGIALGSDYAVGYDYDEYGRFSAVAVSNGATFTYSYVPNSSLLAGYTNTLGLSVAYAYEPLRDLKTLVSNAWFTNTISTFAYTYDALGRRTARLDDGLTTNLFAYNLRSELTTAHMSTNLYAYTYDPIGNRLSATENGATTLYAANSLNQYTALNPASTNPTPFTYDPDGNMTSDGTWSYTWDAENRLIEVQPLVTNLDSTLVQYMYDAQSRRIARREFAWNDYLGETTWHYVQGRAFRYDGWNLLQELMSSDASRVFLTSMSLTECDLTDGNWLVSGEYFWGVDLSGTLFGAGGCGGLLCASWGSTNAFFTCDLIGNIHCILNDKGIVKSVYDYDAFGNVTLLLGEWASINTFRFSSKQFDEILGAYYFGMRDYWPRMGHWGSRDSIEEVGSPFWIWQNQKIRQEQQEISSSLAWLENDLSRTLGFTVEQSKTIQQIISNIRLSLAHQEYMDESSCALYAYCANNPVNSIDIGGGFSWILQGLAGVGIGWGLAYVFNQPYDWKDAAIDFAVSAVGPGLLGKGKNLYRCIKASGKIKMVRQVAIRQVTNTNIRKEVEAIACVVQETRYLEAQMTVTIGEQTREFIVAMEWAAARFTAKKLLHGMKSMVFTEEISADFDYEIDEKGNETHEIHNASYNMEIRMEAP